MMGRGWGEVGEKEGGLRGEKCDGVEEVGFGFGRKIHDQNEIGFLSS